MQQSNRGDSSRFAVGDSSVVGIHRQSMSLTESLITVECLGGDWCEHNTILMPFSVACLMFRLRVTFQETHSE